jgi:hypothetical protein
VLANLSVKARWIAGSVVAAIALTIVVVASSGFATARSVSGFCKVYYQQKHQYIKATANSNSGNLNGLLQGISAIGHLPVMFDKLDRVAPDEIEPDVANIRDTLKAETQQAAGSASDPLGGLASGLALSLMSAASWERVGTYVDTNCPESTYDPGAAAARASAASAANDAAVQQADAALSTALAPLNSAVSQGQQLDLTFASAWVPINDLLQKMKADLAKAKRIAATHDCTATDAALEAVRDDYNHYPEAESTGDGNYSDVTQAASDVMTSLQNNIPLVQQAETALQSSLQSAPGAQVTNTTSDTDSAVSTAQALHDSIEQALGAADKKRGDIETQEANIGEGIEISEIDAIGCSTN